MPHFLCFADLAFSRNKNGSSDERNGNVLNNEGKPSVAPTTAAVVDPATQTTSTLEEAASETSKQGVSLFVREGNKKSSFTLQHVFRLVSESEYQLRGDKDLLKSTQAPANDNGGDMGDVKCHDEGFVPGEKDALMSSASITSCIGSASQKYTPGAPETFLFGGFELITNVKTVEVYVIRSNDAPKTLNSEGETYLTTCKGIPLRELAPLTEPALYIDETMPQGGAKEKKHALDEEKSIKEDKCTFYKFIFVSPGGPRPIKRVRLKFASSTTASIHRSTIVRTLKVKGRLADANPPSRSSQQQSITRQPLSMDTEQFNPGMLNKVSKGDHMGSLASMMAMMGGDGGMSRPMATQMNSQQQQLKQLQIMQQPNQQYAQQQQQHRQQEQNDRQQEMKQAELISSIAGLGIFLRASEERTMNKFESMLTSIEMRMNSRLDNFEKRLDGIEQSVNISKNDEIDSHAQLASIEKKLNKIEQGISKSYQNKLSCQGHLASIEERLDGIEPGINKSDTIELSSDEQLDNFEESLNGTEQVIGKANNYNMKSQHDQLNKRVEGIEPSINKSPETIP